MPGRGGRARSQGWLSCEQPAAGRGCAQGSIPGEKKTKETLLAGWKREGRQCVTYGVSVVVCNGFFHFFLFLILLQCALLHGRDPIVSAPSLLQTDGKR